MTQEPINSWIEQAKHARPSQVNSGEVKVIKRTDAPFRGNLIMDVAEIIRPGLSKLFVDVRDDEGRTLQPANIRAIALNIAHSLVKKHEQKNANG